MTEHFPSRGFQSSISNKIHFGVGNTEKIDSLIVSWPNNKVSKLYNLNTNVTHNIDQKNSANSNTFSLINKKNEEKLNQIDILDHRHIENKFVDFNEERLVPQMFSNEGPAITSSDLNNDNVPDFFIGSSKNQTSSLFLSSGLSYKKIKTLLILIKNLKIPMPFSLIVTTTVMMTFTCHLEVNLSQDTIVI